MIQFSGVTKVFPSSLSTKRIVALADLDLDVQPGQVFGFLGPNGAGKSTTIKLLVYLLFPTTGTVTVLGRSVADPSVRARIGYLPENPYFYDHLTPQELLRFGGSVAGMTRSAIGLRTRELLDLVELTDAADRPLRGFSKGMIQRAGLALALVHSPQVVIFDEPMSGLDPLGRALVARVIRTLKAEGKTVFFSSHILPDVDTLCDQVGIIVKGRLRRVMKTGECPAGEAHAWRIVVDRIPPQLRDGLDRAAVISAHPAGQALSITEPHIYELLDRFHKAGSTLISCEHARETLEEIFLREVNQAGRSDVV